jgi:hypothetical protein
MNKRNQKLLQNLNQLHNLILPESRLIRKEQKEVNDLTEKREKEEEIKRGITKRRYFDCHTKKSGE